MTVFAPDLAGKLNKRADERGFTPILLGYDLLLKRVKDGGYAIKHFYIV